MENLFLANIFSLNTVMFAYNRLVGHFGAFIDSDTSELLDVLISLYVDQ